MKSWPTDHMHQHNRLIAAFCDDLFFGDREMTRAKRVVEISRQVNSTRDAGSATNAPATDK